MKLSGLNNPLHTSNCASLLFLIMLAMATARADLSDLLQLAQQRYDATGVENVSQWMQLIETVNNSTENEKLLLVNDFFNQRILFKTDQSVWGRSDYWATPIETMGRQQGDCEDFSIAKYISLLKLGISVEKLRLTYVKASVSGRVPQAHMVLAYYSSLGSEPLILDNISSEIMTASQRPDLFPVFSFNSAGLWVAGDKNSKVDKPETRLSRWRDVITRMQVEGL